MRRRKYNKYTKLFVEWRDIVQEPSWQSLEDQLKASSTLVKTMGFFLHNHKGDLIIASGVAEDGQADTIVIPWGTITNIEELYLWQQKPVQD